MIAEQRAFASNASHELRTPLTSIRLRSEALRRGTLDEATARQYVAEIDDEVARLGNLVQDLIALSRLDAGRLEAGSERIDTVRLAQRSPCWRSFSRRRRRRGLPLTCRRLTACRPWSPA